MKRFLSVLITAVIAVVLTAGAAAAEQMDYSAYEIKERFTPVEIYMLHGNNAVAQTWNDRYGDIFMDWHATWFRDGEILREVDYNPIGEQFYMPAPHMDGTCGMIELVIVKDPENANPAVNKNRITLYDWNENGLSNPRIIAEGDVDVQVTIGGFAIWNGPSKEISLFDEAGNLCFSMADCENKPVRLMYDRLGNIWMMTVLYGEEYEDNTYVLRHIREGVIQWEQRTDQITSFFPDEQGGLYCVVLLGSGSYRTVGITHLDDAGREDLRKSLSADRVVLGCHISTIPETGEIYLTGRAVANSRNVYKVYRMTLDRNWNMKDLDVREMDYCHDTNLKVLRNLDNEFYVHANGLDEENRGGINPVIIPFDALKKTDNPGIIIR